LVSAACQPSVVLQKNTPVVPTETASITLMPLQSSTETPSPTLMTPEPTMEMSGAGEPPEAGYAVSPAPQTPKYEDQTIVLPSVSVADQVVMEQKVLVAEVVSDGPGWLVIHAQAEGKPGPVLGYVSVMDGINRDVTVEIDVAAATETLYAMLHVDAGTIGSYEYPGPDEPVQVGGQVIAQPFKVSGLSTPQTVLISIRGSSFSPSSVTVRVGTTVVWRMGGGYSSHTVTADNGLFDSGILSGGGTFAYTFAQPGVYPYYCKFHGGPNGQGMSGVITVIK
jgi:plastocyanin